MLLACLTTTAMALVPTAPMQSRFAIGRPLKICAQAYDAKVCAHVAASIWKACFIDGQTYYSNNLGESSWELPPGAELAQPAPGDAVWTVHVDDNGQTYYSNAVSGEAAWELPPGAVLVSGTLDFGNYRQFVREREGVVPEAELRQRFDALNVEAKAYTSYGDYAPTYTGRQPTTPGEYTPTYTGGGAMGGAYNYAPQRAARLSARRDPNRMPTKLQEFLRWQEWYVQYCRLRKIN